MSLPGCYRLSGPLFPLPLWEGDYPGLDLWGTGFCSWLGRAGVLVAICAASFLFCVIAILVWAWVVIAQRDKVGVAFHFENGANASFVDIRREAILERAITNIDHDVKFVVGRKVGKLTWSECGNVGRKFGFLILWENKFAPHYRDGRPIVFVASVAPTAPVGRAFNIDQRWSFADIFNAKFNSRQIVPVVPIRGNANVESARLQNDLDIGPKDNFIGFDRGIYGISRAIQRTISQYDSTESEQRINANSYSCALSPQKYFVIVFGALLLGGFVLFCKGVYRNNDSIMWGGWFAGAIGLIGVLIVSLGHCSFCTEKAYVSSIKSSPG